MFSLIFPLINLLFSHPLFISLPVSLSSFLPFYPLPNQEASSRLPARLTAAGNAAVCVAVPAQEREKGAGGEGEEWQRASAQEEQSQKDEVSTQTPFQENQQKFDLNILTHHTHSLPL